MVSSLSSGVWRGGASRIVRAQAPPGHERKVCEPLEGRACPRRGRASRWATAAVPKTVEQRCLEGSTPSPSVDAGAKWRGNRLQPGRSGFESHRRLYPHFLDFYFAVAATSRQNRPVASTLLVKERLMLRFILLATGLAVGSFFGLSDMIAQQQKQPVGPANWHAEGMNGAVCVGGNEARDASMAMLKSGGNAADASATALLIISVTVPVCCFGGEVPIIYYDKKTGTIEVICGQGAA